MRFDNKIVLITGAASGIGLAIARHFLAEGATVIGTDIDEQALTHLDTEGNPKFITRVSDAGNPAAIKELAGWIDSKYGALDVLVNNAGYAVLASPESVDEVEYMAQMAVLINGPIFLVKYLASLLRASDNGSVVNIASGAAVISLPHYCPYGTAKAALVKFTEDCVISVPGVRHNAILPGFIDTPILNDAYGEETVAAIKGFLETSCPVPRVGTTGDVSAAALFLASRDASFITGTNILVDGGLCKIHPLGLLG